METQDAKLIVALRNIFLFESLDGERLDYVACCAELLQVPKGEHLFREGDVARYLYGVAGGVLKLYRVTSAGDEFVVHIQRTGDLVAEAAMFDISRYPANCVATEHSTVVRISAKGFVAILLDHPELGLDLMHAYSRRLRGFVTALEDLSLRDVKSRLARYMLSNSETRDGVNSCTLPCSKKELAALLGTIPETLSRTLREFKGKGAIEEQSWGFIILREDLLKQWVGE
ncbi:MAG: Crp/Fnr family transcriptional regulator [Bacteroidia bacterium]|nr:Crp/Fnr family transcriptional regulator [Bacteroidia bacterium]